MRRHPTPLCLLALLLTACQAPAPTTPAAAPAADSRAAFLKLLERPRVAPEVAERPMDAPPGMVQTHLAFTPEAGQRMPAILMRSAALPAGARLPVVIVLHGTGSTKNSNLSHLKAFAARGFLAVAPDGRYHGERCAAGKGTDDYYAAIAQAYKDGKSHPWLYDTVWDVMRLVDVLQARPDVDPQRIGIMGFSKGGMETYLAAAADPRLAVAVPCIGVQSYRWALENGHWPRRVGTVKGGFEAAAAQEGIAKPDGAFARKFYDRVVPGIYGPFDGPAMLAQIAPRPLLVINGAEDGLTPVPGLRLALQAAAAAYLKAGAFDRFELVIQERTGHQVRPEAMKQAVAWFERWLKPTAPATSSDTH